MFKIFNKKPLIGITFVFVVALFFRFFMLTKYPIHLSMDEVAIGVNAYEILKTGRDEHGVVLPLAFKSVGDYKPPVNIYLTVISQFFLGFNEFSTRLPVALIGSLTAVFLILLLRKLNLSWFSSIFGGFWLAVAPWHIHFSRGSFEAITALFFLILGTYLYLSWVNAKKTWFLLGSIASFSLSVWSYHAERFFVPILALFLIVSYRKEIKFKLQKIQRQILWGVVAFLLFAIPFINLAVFTPAVAQRAASTSILREASLATSLHGGNYASIEEKIFDNDYFLTFRHWAGKYLNYFDIRFLFWKGMQFTPPGYPDLGLLYAIDLPIFLFGIYSLVKSDNKKLKSLAVFWFFTGPLSASFTMNEQHPLRALTWIPFFAIVNAAAIEEIGSKLKRFSYFLIPYIILLVVNIVYFGDVYIHQFPWFYAESWQYGYKQVAQYSCENLPNYDKILISDTFGREGPLNTGLPYLYILFYCPSDMENFVATGQHLEKFNFRRPNTSVLKEKGKLLLIGAPWDFLDGDLYGGKIVNEVAYPSGEKAFLFVERK